MLNKHQVYLGDKQEVNKEIQKLSQSSKAQQLVSSNLIEDPSLYDYDGFVSKKNKSEKALVIQKQTEDKKSKQPQFLNSILEQSKRREFEREATKSRMNAKEAIKSGKEVYISESFKQQHEQIKRFEQIEQIQEKINDESRKRSNLGIYKSLYDNETKKGQHSKSQEAQVDSYKIIENILIEKEKQKNTSQVTANQQEDMQEKSEKEEIQENKEDINNKLKNAENSKSRSRSRSKSTKEQKQQENEALTKEDKLKQYKERYLQRKQL
ncbi:unnamed protein product (macronuclear) [Paramecium tetraurelia]|uniref:Nuclear speckle splicing regulatory protein 1 N-terminal domain-containing protein n=1 Tax=Paramecium tetraurelia TaxID=5888 RepID=A0BIA1_PARTE|nr:uncharacterized protein GSPATT00004640001 [Paramecium tetraurelia]CAK58268.1 unnamed protein product [Paramecium tetraurelia]|eukprot:XP_001425666.1 hypothetical protein (macronuclear) [Paramecium tetraurelia strain d4-2]